MHRTGLNLSGRFYNRIATFLSPPYKASVFLAHITQKGYIAPTVQIHHDSLALSDNIFIAAHAEIFQAENGGPVTIGNKSRIHRNCIIGTGSGGQLIIGSDTHIQPRCQFSAYVGTIKVMSRVQIAPNCSFYPYDHGFKPHRSIMQQPLDSEGDILIEDDAWIGVGATILEGVTIGQGAIIGAGSVVTKSIPANSIAFGIPARVIKKRS